MAYTRWRESGHYIYGGNDYVDFNGRVIPDDEVDVFIYKLYGYLKEGDEEFWERYYHGSRVIDNFHKGIELKKHYKHSYELESIAASVTTLADEIWREYYTPIIGVAQVDYMLAKFQSAEQICADIKTKDYIYFTATHIKHDKLVGYSACQPKEGYLLLSKIYVHKDYRGNGISRSFLEEAFALCLWEYNIDKIRLTVNKRNDSTIAMYRKMGFEIINSVKTDIGDGFFMDDFVMEILVEPKETECVSHVQKPIT